MEGRDQKAENTLHPTPSQGPPSRRFSSRSEGSRDGRSRDEAPRGAKGNPVIPPDVGAGSGHRESSSSDSATSSPGSGSPPAAACSWNHGMLRDGRHLEHHPRAGTLQQAAPSCLWVLWVLLCPSPSRREPAEPYSISPGKVRLSRHTPLLPPSGLKQRQQTSG